MNILTVGFDKSPLLQFLPEKFLFIDDGPLIDKIYLPKRRAVTYFDVATHSFNPLKDMQYLQARQFVAVLNAAFPEGENTLTRRYSNFILLNALLAKPRKLTKLIEDSKDPHQRDAYQKIQTLLLSPVISDILTRPTNISFKGIIIARLDRSVLGDFDCFVLANLLINQYRGPVVIPDFGFYAHKGHAALIRQDRLIAGVNALSQVPELRDDLLSIETKLARRANAEDAKALAVYAGLIPGFNDHDFIQESIGNRS